MNAVKFSSQIKFYLFVFTILSFFSIGKAATGGDECQWRPVGQNDFNEVLIMIESRVKENYDKINTWQGKTKVVSEDICESDKGKKFYETLMDVRPLPNKIKERQEFTREFALDINKGLLYESVYPDGENYIIDAETGKKLPLKDQVHLGSAKYIRAPDYQIDCMDNKNRSGLIVSRTVIKQVRPQNEQGCGSSLSHVFDPRDTMRIYGDIFGKTFDPLGGTFTKYLALFSREHSIDGYPTIKVEECNVGGVKKYKIVLVAVKELERKIYRFDTLICSSASDFNVVLYSVTDENGRVFENVTWEYDLFNGVYLPVQKTELDFDDNTGNLKEKSIISFNNLKVNESISDEVFTYKNLGLQDGDAFIDKISDKRFTYQNGELVELAKDKL